MKSHKITGIIIGLCIFVVSCAGGSGGTGTSVEQSQTQVNQAPIVNAGSGQIGMLPDAVVFLAGTVIDDGLPGGSMTIGWIVVSGPAAVVFGDSSAVDAMASFTVAGTYVLRLTADDGELTASDEATVVITDGQTPLNQAPTVDAGPGQAAMLPDALVSLAGTVTDDGLPGGPMVTGWSVVSGPAAVSFGDSATVDTMASFTVAGTYVLRLTADDGELTASDDVTVVITEDLSFVDNFDSDTTSSYTVTDTWTVGGVGSFSYDASRKQALVQTGDDIGLQISKTLTFPDRGVFKFIFSPTVKYPLGGSMTLRLKEDDNNFIEVRNTDGYGPGQVKKVIGGTLADTAPFNLEYSQNDDYEIIVYFTPQAIVVEGFGQTVAISADQTSLVINSIEIELRQQDAFLDNLALQSLPFSKIIGPAAGYWQDTVDLNVKSVSGNLQAGWTVRFILGSGGAGPLIIDQPVVAPNQFIYEADFINIPKAEYSIDTVVLDESDTEILTDELIDTAFPVTLGAYYFSAGASIARGSQDDIPSDDVSADGSNTGGGFPPILNDLLTAEKNYPHTVYNEGVSGLTTLDGVNLIDSLLAQHPYARYVLILYGTNDAKLDPEPTPSGLGLPPTHVDYPGTFKANVQAIIDAIVAAGKTAYLAKLPIAYPPFDFANPQLQIYNQVIDELASENSIQVTPPDLYTWFETHPEHMSSDGLHPNGLGYQAIAALWRDAIVAASP